MFPKIESDRSKWSSSHWFTEIFQTKNKPCNLGMFLPSSLDPTWKSASIHGFLSGKGPLHTWPQQCCNLLLLYFSTIMYIWDIPTYIHFKLQEWWINQNPFLIVFPCKLATFPTILSPGWVLVDVVNLGAIGAAISSSLGHGFLMCSLDFNWGNGVVVRTVSALVGEGIYPTWGGIWIDCCEGYFVGESLWWGCTFGIFVVILFVKGWSWVDVGSDRWLLGILRDRSLPL